ncbi:MAG: hypothetical protein AAGE52_24210 [Myxococcota bacterium]
MTLHPDNGGRVLFELADDGDPVRYRVTLFTPADRFEGTAAIGRATGDVETAGFDEAPAWLTAQVRPFLRQLWSARRDGGPRWPRRVMRWRQER